MIDNLTTKPLQHTAISSRRPIAMNWRERGVGLCVSSSVLCMSLPQR